MDFRYDQQCTDELLTLKAANDRKGQLIEFQLKLEMRSQKQG